MRKTSRATVCLITLLASATLAHAELYKSVDAKGHVTYSDVPPTSATRIERKSVDPAGDPNAALPYELARAAASNPVTLYTTESCAPCDAARRFLAGRGIPFTERTVSTRADAARLHDAVGSADQLPAITVGRARQAGFASGEWTTMLTAAGYPESNLLPKAYHNPPPQPAAPALASAPRTEPVVAARPETPPAEPAARFPSPPAEHGS
ncbi:MAG: DUF4124 domain-containing protein, partial [Burkholderiaceae bacterium]